MTASLFPRLESPENRVALVVRDRSVTYRELAMLCAGHLDRLEQLGTSPGDRVAVIAQPTLETAIALAAHAMGGIVSVPINPSVGDRELSYIVGDAKPRRVLAADPSAVASAKNAIVTIEPLTIAPSTAPRAGHRGNDDDPALVLYTSGTTGAPKGAVLTRRNVSSNLDSLARAWAWTENDTLVHALPLFHVHGLCLGLFGSLRAGATLRVHPKFSPESIAQEFDHGATMLFAVPTMYHRLAEASEREGALARSLGRARLLVSGSAALPVREHQRMEKLTGLRVVERYGLTETLINTAVRWNGDRRPGYVGSALDGIELRLVDDARVPIAARDDVTIGEVAVRGPNVFAGYLNRDDATAQVRDADGWFYTGDLATMASDGYVRIVGRRATDLIKTGGFKVGAGEIEAALLEHSAVREAAVIGVEDEDLGERIVAFVVANGVVHDRELIDFVAGSLSPHKRPRVVHQVAELPRNAMGKVVKGSLRALHALRTTG